MKQVNKEDAVIGQRVRAARVALKMSQETLAKPLGLTFQQVQKYENGTNRISGSRLLKIAATLKVSAGYLLGEDKGSPAPNMLDGLTAPGGAELMKAFSTMEPKLQRLVLEMVRAFASARAVRP